MENTQVSKLKINVNNIKSSLFKSNKELISLKKERLKLTFTQEERRKLSKKEDSSESQGSFVQSVKNIGKRLISGPLSFIDKFKEFFGLILLGIVVNNLPAIVQKLQDVFTKIQTFLDQNPWIIDAVKFGFKMIGDGIMGLAKFIRFIGPYIGGSFKFALDTLKSARIQVEGLISTFVDLNSSFGKLAKDLNIDKIPDASKDPSKYSNFIAGGGKKALEEKGLTVDEVIEQGKKNISRPSRSPQPQPQSQKPVQKLARGGTVGNIPPQEGTGRGGPSDIAKKKSSTTTTRSPFTKTESGGARRARESVNYFETFNKTLNETKENTILEKKNIESFEEMANNFKQFSDLMQKFSIFNPTDPNPPGDGSGELIEMDGKTYTAEGGELPNQDKFFTSGFGYRNTGIPGASTYHQGVDFAHPVDNIPVSVIRSGTVLHAGSAGTLGNYVEIKHDNGVITGYGHLSSIKVRKDQVISPGTVIGNQGDTGISNAPHVHFTYKPPGGQLSNGRNFANSYFRFGGNVKLKELSFAGGNNAEKVWNFFKSAGLSDVAVAGILGNARQESGPNIDPSIAYSESIQGKPARFIGIFQWGNGGNGNRWGKLVNWAKKEKKNPESIDTQLQFALQELKGPGPYKAVRPLLDAAKTPEEAAQIWYKNYEGASHGLAERKAFAKDFYQRYKGKKPPTPQDPVRSLVNDLTNKLLRSSSGISSPETSLVALGALEGSDTNYIINRTVIVEKRTVLPSPVPV